jgi:hypothetical protein
MALLTHILISPLLLLISVDSESSSNYLSNVTFEKQVGISIHQYQEGWRGHNPNIEYTRIEAKNKPTFNAILNFNLPVTNKNLIMGSGLDILIQDPTKLNKSNNRFNRSFLRLGYGIAGHKIITGLGWSKFFEQEHSYGQSISIELIPKQKMFGKNISIKFMHANTDYEPRGQGPNDPALRFGSTQNISLLVIF